MIVTPGFVGKFGLVWVLGLWLKFGLVEKPGFVWPDGLNDGLNEGRIVGFVTVGFVTIGLVGYLPKLVVGRVVRLPNEPCTLCPLFRVNEGFDTLPE